MRLHTARKLLELYLSKKMLFKTIEEISCNHGS